MTTLGIDSGKKGAICLLERGAPRWWRIPLTPRGEVDVAALGTILFGLPTVRQGVLERPPRSMGRQGSFAQWDSGRHFGQLETVLAVARIPFLDPTPGEWQRFMGVSLPRGWRNPDGTKPTQEQRRREIGARCVAEARRLYPGADLRWPGGQVPSVDKAVSLLLAELAARRG